VRSTTNKTKNGNRVRQTTWKRKWKATVRRRRAVRAVAAPLALRVHFRFRFDQLAHRGANA
jgi:hypothetical protein